MNTQPVDFADVQGLIRFGYSKLTDACYYLLRVRDVPSACEWLRTAPVANAVIQGDAPASAVQVAFTSTGLRALGVPQEVLAGFSPEFLSGMADDTSRSRRLGDVAANSPVNWRWGGPGSAPHVVVMLFARAGQLAALKQVVASGSWTRGFELIDCLPTSNLCGFEPFGFVDGVSQPAIDWERSQPARLSDKLEYSNVHALGEFLLGYPNEYGKYTQRPLLGRDPSRNSDLLSAEDDPQKLDLGRNGTYIVFRQLKQDVANFWRYLHTAASGDAGDSVRLAEAMVGRKITGETLMPVQGEPIDGVAKDDTRNQFTYSSDPEGLLCPLGAHIRRANPRNADLSGANGFLRHLLRMLGFGAKGWRDDLVASARFHRILRRGREYGPKLTREEAIAGQNAAGEQGLHFICVNANIARQFEFVQNAWLMSANFDGLGDESDPLLGNREPLLGGRATNHFSVPVRDGLPPGFCDVPQFVTVVGGAYFFMPSIRALRYLAGFAR